MASGSATPAQAAAWLARDAVDSLPAGELERKLVSVAEQGRSLRVKLGIDPTAPDLHLGHTVVLRKLQEFQGLGHQVVLIVGDYTARVGDPSGRSQIRPLLTGEQVDANARRFADQAAHVLDVGEVELRFNGEWLDMATHELFALARTTTIAQLLERDDFAKRQAAHEPVSVLELLYPLLQGYDSVAVKADVELGGTDQKFNLLLGRDIQRAYGEEEQAILTMPILPGTDGVRKMSKSLGNEIAVLDRPEQIYAKTLRVPDDALAQWWELLCDEPPSPGLSPRDAKRTLARSLVARFHDEAAAQDAERAFDRVFVDHELPEEIEDASFHAGDGEVHLPALVAELFGMSRSEARRLQEQGGVRIGGAMLSGAELDLAPEMLDGQVLQVGKRRHRRLHRRG
ncbi:MAG: tyrosine--tRNA ligase [Solirubrobacteraceae bacterium]|nr:MAG: tyrosine--tRNA ligase [Solirubrobacterales bacterium]